MRIIRIMALGLVACTTPVLGHAAEPVGGGDPGVTRARYLMGTLCEARAYGPLAPTSRALDAALDRIAELDDVMTTFRPAGELARLNERLAKAAEEGTTPVTATVSEDLFRALHGALELAEITEGRFDPTVGPLAEAWGLREGGRHATRQEILAARARTSYRHVALDESSRSVTVHAPGVSFDLGGFGKGFALDEASRVLRRAGVDRAMLNFGGQVLALDAPPGQDGWLVDLAHPRDRLRPAGSTVAVNTSVATSGNVERAIGSPRPGIGHVLDPRTGAPARFTGSATVAAPRAAQADALATALVVAGPEGPVDFVPGDASYVFLVPGDDGGREEPEAIGTLAIESARPSPDSEPADQEREEREDDDDARIEELERKLAILAEELEKLRRGGTDARVEEGRGRGMHGLAPAASKVYRKDRGFSLGGYGEWLYENFDVMNDAGTPSGRDDRADFLRLILYTGYKFNERILFNAEIEFEHASTGKDGEVSVEFAYLDFLVSPRVNVRTGLVLVPVGIVNELHEPPTFLGARRPDVETVILPTTWRELGAGVFGELGPFVYRAFLVTGLDGSGFSASSGLRGGRQKGSKASAEDLALAARLDLSGVPGLVAGVSVFRGDSGQGSEVSGEEVNGTVTTLDGHVEWRWRGLELRALVARVDVDDAMQLSTLAGETIGSRMTGYYVSAGYDVLAGRSAGRHQLIPFVRYEELDTQARVPSPLSATVTGANDREVFTVGAVYKPIESVAVKADFQDHDNRAGTGVDQLNVAVGFYF